MEEAEAAAAAGVVAVVATVEAAAAVTVGEEVVGKPLKAHVFIMRTTPCFCIICLRLLFCRCLALFYRFRLVQP